MTYQISSNRTVSGIIILSHFASLLVLIPLSLPLWSYLVVTLLLVASALLSLHKTVALQLPLGSISKYFIAIRQFSWDSTGAWRIWTTDGTELQVELRADSAIYSCLLVLNFRTLPGSDAQRNTSLLLTERQLPPHEFRRLRVRLGLQSALAMSDSPG